MTTITCDIQDAIGCFYRLVEEAHVGNQVIILRNGQPVIRLQAIGDSCSSTSRIGGLKGREFDEAAFERLDGDIADLFEDKATTSA